MATAKEWAEATPSEWEAMYQAAAELPSEVELLCLFDGRAEVALWLSARGELGPPGSVPVGLGDYLAFIEHRMDETRRLPALVGGVLQTVGALRSCSLEELQDAVNAVCVDAPLIPSAVVDLSSRDETIVGALLCLASLPEEAHHSAALMAALAAEEVRNVGNDQLWPLRQGLLGQVVAGALDPQMVVDALVALALLEPKLNRKEARASAQDESIRLLSEARTIARDHCDAPVWANATVLWVRQTALVALTDPADHAAKRSELMEILDEVEAATDDPIARAQLLRARATVVAQPSPHETRGDHAAAAELLDKALELAPEVDGWWLDTVRELASNLNLSGQPKAAISWLQRCLRVEGGLQSPADHAWVLMELSRAHHQLGDADEAERCASESTRLAGSATERVLFELQRLVDLTGTGALSRALALAHRIGPEVHRLEAPLQLDYWQAVMICQLLDMEWDAAKAAYEKACGLAGPTGRKTVLDLLWARFMGGPEGAVHALVSYAAGSLGPSSPAADEQAMHVVDDHAKALNGGQCAIVAKWAMSMPSPGNAVAVLVAIGDLAGARATIAFSLGSATDEEKLTLLCHRVMLDPDAPLGDRRSWVVAAVDLAARLPELPFEAVFNLAQACTLVAQDDPAWWGRALAWWPRAWGLAADPLQRRQASERWLLHLYEWERRSRIGCQPALANWLQAYRPAAAHLANQLVGGLRAVLANALIHGALTHPRVLDEVEALGDLHPDVMQDVLLRALSIRQAHKTPNVGISAVEGAPGLPALPQQVVDAALGHEASGFPREVVEDLSIWSKACQLRPDLSDTVLAAGLRAATALPVESPEDWLKFAHMVVQQGDWGGTAWTKLSLVVLFLPSQTPGRTALLLTLQRAGAGLDAGDLPQSAENTSAVFEQAVAKMNRVRKNPRDPEAQNLKAAAIEELRGLAAEPTELSSVDVFISLGNALRLPPEPDLDGAIEIYRSIPQDGLLDEQVGKLHKVWADALRDRAGDGDIAAAWGHLEQALRLRRGRLLAETHLSAALLAGADESLTAEARTVRAASHMVEAVKLGPALMGPLQGSVFAAVRQWVREAPGTVDASSVRRVLIDAWPESGASIDECLAGMTRSTVASQMHASVDDQMVLLDNPSMRAFVDLIDGLAGVHAEQRSDALRSELLAMRGIALPATANIWNDPDAIGDRLAKIEGGPAEEQPGRKVAEVHLRARLVRLMAAEDDGLRELTRAARAAIEGAALPPVVAATLLGALAEVWAPDDDRSDPVRDFALAVELSRAAIARGPTEPDRDMLGRLARALRYSAEGDRRANWEEARRLHERVLAKDRESGHAGFIANTLHLLAELVCHVDGGDFVARHREAVVLLREAVELATTDEMKGRYLGNLAWDLARIACHSPDKTEVEQCRIDAERCFDEALGLLSDPGLAGNLRDLQSTFRSSMARRDGDTHQAIQIERDRLEERLRNGSPYAIATARHNLGDVLSTSGDPALMAEAELILREALAHRRAVSEPRTVWETATCLAELLLARGRLDSSSGDEIQALLTEAADAARALGPGDEVHRNARALAGLALATPAVDTFASRAETAWTWMCETIPSLILADDLAISDADVASRCMARAAQRAIDQHTVAVARGARIVGARASAPVLAWWTRAESTWRRRSRARLELPPGAPMAALIGWREALASGRAGGLPALLRSIHHGAPGWLTEPPTLDATRAWLRSHDALAIGAWPLSQGVLLALVGPRPEDDRIAWLPGLGLADDEAALAVALRPRSERAAVLQRLKTWAETNLARRIQALHGRAPKAVLWVPHGALRYLPHASLFGSTPTWRSPTLALAPPAAHRSRGDGVSVIIAEPADQPIGDHVIAEATALGTEPKRRLLIARGPAHGAAAHPKAEPLTVDANTVVGECDHAGTVVIMAHGHASTADDAWLHMLRADGSEDRLDMARLSRDPRALAGLRIVLLSCEAGRTGDQPSEPGGIAGVLLAAGAAEVVAPLWPVDALTAVKVGRALLDGQAEGRSWPKVLATLNRKGVPQDGGAELGRPSQGAREAGKWDVPAFVCFVS